MIDEMQWDETGTANMTPSLYSLFAKSKLQEKTKQIMTSGKLNFSKCEVKSGL